MKAMQETRYAKAFMMHQGSKHMNLQALTHVSDRETCAQPTQRQLEA